MKLLLFSGKARTDEGLWADKDVALAAVSLNGRALQHVSIQLKANKDVVLAAVKQNGDALQYASLNLQTDRDILVAAVGHFICP